MQRQEANFGSICKSLNVKGKKARLMGVWVAERERGGWTKGRRGGDKFLSPPLLPLSLPPLSVHSSSCL